MSMIAKRMRRAVGLDERSIGHRYANLVDSGPITVATGQVVRGLRIKGQSGTAITVPSGVHDVLIEDCEIGPMNLSGTADVGINIGGGAYGITV